MTRRSRGREVALQLLFQHEHNPKSAPAAVAELSQDRLPQQELRQFCLTLYEGVLLHQKALDEKLAAAAENWRVARMASVDRNVLRLGAYELLHMPETPAAVVCDEAVELARRFGTADSSAFVNGVLDRIRREAAAPPA
jgi:transcription antitermination protein NusB